MEWIFKIKEKDKIISGDENKKLSNDLQKITDEYIGKLNQKLEKRTRNFKSMNLQIILLLSRMVMAGGVKI